VATRYRRPDGLLGERAAAPVTSTAVHAAYEELLTNRQRELVLASYTAFLDQFGTPPGEPTESGVQHHLVALLLTAVLGRGTPYRSVAYARSVLDEVGLLRR
jgi:hypothetical protein